MIELIDVEANLNSSPHTGRVISRAFLSGVPIGYTGIVAGFLTGLSRSPAVDALASARNFNVCWADHSLHHGKRASTPGYCRFCGRPIFE
jgi:hypothetical protein